MLLQEIIRTIIAQYLEIKSGRDEKMEETMEENHKTLVDETSYFNTVLFNITRIIQSYGDKGWYKIANSFKLDRTIDVDNPEDLEYLASGLARDFVYKNFEKTPATTKNIEEYLRYIIAKNLDLNFLMSA